MRFVSNILLALAFSASVLTVSSCCCFDGGDGLDPVVHDEGGGGTT